MRYIIAVIVGLAMLALSSPVLADDHTWQRPTECADEDRQVSGNRSTPCEYVMPVLEKIVYDVRMVYPKCLEILILDMPGMKPLPDDVPRDIYSSRFSNQYGIGSGVLSDVLEWKLQRGRTYIVADRIARTGYSWGLGDSIQSTSSFNYVPRYGVSTYQPPYMRISLFGSYGPWSNAALHPDLTNMVELVNSCLVLVAQEKADREHADEIERQEQAEAARLKAERDAAEKEEEQAQREAESQARIAERQLAAANERRLTIARAEEIKTQTLIDEITLQEVLTAILNDIVRIRLAGQEDRARITNEYLARARTVIRRALTWKLPR